jgi:triacylglycerol lipase
MIQRVAKTMSLPGSGPMNELAIASIPKPNAKVIFPPNRDHAFFALADKIPFDHAAADFSWANAWWLAEAALLAYDDPGNVCAHFEVAGFEVCDAELLSEGAAQCYVVRNEHAVVVAFRGTETIHRSSDRSFLEKTVDVVNDVVANVQVAPHWLDEETWVHRGFHSALEGILEWQLRPLLAEF